MKTPTSKKFKIFYKDQWLGSWFPEEPQYDEQIPDWKITCSEEKLYALPIMNPEIIPIVGNDGNPIFKYDGNLYNWIGDVEKITESVGGYSADQRFNEAEIESYFLSLHRDI